MLRRGMMASAAPPAPAVTFDPAKKGADIVLSSGNLRSLHPSGGGQQVLSTAGYSSGKRYFEMLCNAVGGVACVGFARAGGATDLESDLGQEAGEYGWYYNGSSYFAGSFGAVSGLSFTTGSVIGVAIDFGTRRAWWRVNGTWIGSGNPAAGTGQQVTYASGLGTIYAAVSGNTGSEFTARFRAADITGSIPSGFSAWD